jgi:RimJ/RimL family protein N-acetyltransferase
VSLRTPESEDAAFLQRSFTEPALRHPLGTPLRRRHEVESSLESEEESSPSFLVCAGDDEGPGPVDEAELQRVGSVSVADIEYRRPDIAYWIAPERHAEGIGSTAVSLAVDYLFRTNDHPAVGAVAYEFNDASRGLLESLGFEEEGRIRRDRFVDGEYVDTIHYGLLREDWWADRPRHWREE